MGVDTFLPSFLAGSQRLANFFRSAEQAGFCFVPSFTDLAAGIGPPGFLLLQQPQCLAHHVVRRLKFTGSDFAAHKVFERHGQAHIHGVSFTDAALIVKSLFGPVAP